MGRVQSREIIAYATKHKSRYDHVKAGTTTTVEREVYPIRCYVLMNMSPDYINSIAGVTGRKRLAEAWKAQDSEMRDYECFTAMESLDSEEE